MRPFELAEGDRAAYHAAASIASNFLITLEAAAERLAIDAGADREVLVPLVRATVENWARLGPRRALTGPVARGDEPTVAAQRAAVARRAPDLLAMFDAMVDATRVLAAGEPAPATTTEVAPEATSAQPRHPRSFADEDDQIPARAACRAGAGPPRGPRDRPGPDDGSLPRRPPLADAARARGDRHRRRMAVRQSRTVQRLGRPRRLPTRRGARRRARRRRGRRLPVRARRPRTSTRPASRPPSRSRG